MKRTALSLGVVLLWAGLICAQDTCIPYILEPCEGDPQLYECANVTSSVSATTGGEHAAFLQEFCFKVQSPLFGEITVNVNIGTLAINALKVGDVLGELMFDVKLSDFGAVCEDGDNARLYAPITVTTVEADYADVEVKVTEASTPIINCLLRYDPTDDEHNGGRILQGNIGTGAGGGFELYLVLADLIEQGAMYPGLEYGDLSGTASPVPLYFRPLTKSDIYTLPAAGGTLTVATSLAATNMSGSTVEHLFLEDFTITPGVVVPQFRRGDANADGTLNIADAVTVLGYLFGGGTTTIGCLDTGDGNDDGLLNIADAVKILGHLFASAGPLPDPFAGCGPDPTNTDALTQCNFPAEKCP